MPRPRNSGSIYERFERHANRTFAEAATRYLSEFQGRDKRRVATCIEAVAPYIGHLRLIDVDDEAMAQYKEDRRLGRPPFAFEDGRPRPAMVGTINKELTQVVTILNKACRVWRWLPSAPKLEHVKGPHKQAYPFTWEEQDDLFTCLPTGWAVGAALFAINTGCRKEEIFGLKWSDRRWVPELDIKDAEGNVKERMYVFVLSETKNNHQRAVVCNAIARRAVAHEAKRQFKDQMKTEYVFPSRQVQNYGGRITGMSAIWERAWEKSGLPKGKLIKRGIHSCRHTFAHRLRAAGVPEEDRNALLGHANTNLAQHYATPDLERLLSYAERVTVRKETTVLRAVSSAPTHGEEPNGGAA
jgi:integrase